MERLDFLSIEALFAPDLLGDSIRRTGSIA